jgi:hypothetical protein
MSQALLYPLRFEPIYRYRLWGDRHLAGLLAAPLPGDGPIGEGNRMPRFQLQRLEFTMEPEPGNPQEVEGVLNPAAARGPGGKLYLFPRLVAKGNYSRIGIAGVRFNEAGDPAGVERLGIALEPEADYELRPGGDALPPVFQGMDGGGKHGAIRRVMSGVNGSRSESRWQSGFKM